MSIKFCVIQEAMNGCQILKIHYVVVPIVCGGLLLGICFVLQYFFVISSLAIISLGKI